ncbi:MAG: DUF2007 domain-containing protein [Deltaproteobacteria bacterium]|nr:DUF2007 domain-containing protein [Deltaproteobacteria bacterium]MBI3077939.1 DUF2007 domain-containing protein [Deltaproteobacteria bacterium]
MPLTEVYICYSHLEAERVRALLDEAGIPSGLRDLGMSPYPLQIGEFNQKRVAVLAEQAAEARAVLATAREDGWLSGEGQLLGEAQGEAGARQEGPPAPGPGRRPPPGRRGRLRVVK